MKNSIICGAALLCAHVEAVIVNFEDLTPTQVYTGPGGGAFENGLNDVPDFESGPLTFETGYSPDFGGYWSGWSYSNTSDAVTADLANQYSAYPGSGVDGSANYVIGNRFGGVGLDIPANFDLVSVQLAITTFSAGYILSGDDQFATRAFGGDADLVDLFQVNISGTLGGVEVASPFEVNLADSSLGGGFGISEEWVNVDLSSLASADRLVFTVVNTQGGVPSYFALDNFELTAVPEPTTAVLGFACLALFSLRRRR